MSHRLAYYASGPGGWTARVVLTPGTRQGTTGSGYGVPKITWRNYGIACWLVERLQGPLGT